MQVEVLKTTLSIDPVFIGQEPVFSSHSLCCMKLLRDQFTKSKGSKKPPKTGVYSLQISEPVFVTIDQIFNT
jgi:hypothetical protein